MTIYKQQTDKLWNWCGFKYHWYPAQYGGFSKQCGWYLNGVFHCKNRPDKNIGNFDRYVIPLLQHKGYNVIIMCFEHKGFDVTIFDVTKINPFVFGTQSDNLTKALLNVIMATIEYDNSKKK